MSVALKYRPDIDGLRAVAVMAVVMHHLSTTLVPGGYIGVDVFFVISGYLITKIISGEIEEGTFTFGRFYERRVRRLFPALFAMLAGTLVAGWLLLLPSDYFATFRAALGTLFLSSNLIFWKSLDAGYFAPNAKLNPLLHTWSLGVEEQFYLFFPILMLFCARHAKRHVLAIMLACAALSLIAASVLVKDHPVAVFFLSPFRAWELLVGVLLALNAVPAIESRVTRELVAGLGLLAVVGASLLYDTATAFPGLSALVPALGAAALIHAGSSGTPTAIRILRWRPLVYVGLISYSLYLWHWPLIVFTRFSIGMESIAPYVPGLLVASLLLGALSFHFVEEPFRRGGTFTRRRLGMIAAPAAMGLMAVCLVGLFRAGFTERFSPDVLAFDQARRPPIPFVECDRSAEWCRLGADSIEPTILLWGDSHLLAWAPAWDRVLAAEGASAVFVASSGCPPLLGVESRRMPGCAHVGERVRAFLTTHPELDTVVLSAHWTSYLGPKSPMEGGRAERLAPVSQGPAAVGLARTLRWLESEHRNVYLIAPVPTYKRNVPLTLALRRAWNRERVRKTMEMHVEEQQEFFKVVRREDNPMLTVLDPAEWMCRPRCALESKGVAFYRDSNHLSVAGALAYAENLRGSWSRLDAVRGADVSPPSRSSVQP